MNTDTRLKYESYIKSVTDAFIAMQADKFGENNDVYFLVNWSKGLEYSIDTDCSKNTLGLSFDELKKHNSAVAAQYLKCNMLSYEDYVDKILKHDLELKNYEEESCIDDKNCDVTEDEDKVDDKELAQANENDPELDEETVSAKYPSICYTCKNSRKTWSIALQNNGYVGCCSYVKYDCSHEIVESAYEIAEGWVDLRSRPFTKPSGITTNIQLITKETKKCSKYTNDENH